MDLELLKRLQGIFMLLGLFGQTDELTICMYLYVVKYSHKK